MSSKIEDLDPSVQGTFRLFLHNLAAQGIKGFIPQNGISTLRTPLEQLALWAQGRTSYVVLSVVRQHAGLPPIDQHEASDIVTKADGINSLSNHQDGRAIDWVPFHPDGTPIWYPNTPEEIATYRKAGAIAKACGIQCGMDWTGGFVDWDHFEIPK